MNEYKLDESQVEIAIRKIIGNNSHLVSLEFLLAHFKQDELARQVITKLCKSGELTLAEDEKPFGGRKMFLLNRNGLRVDNPFKKGYCERTKELLLEANTQYKTWDNCPYIIIDYPLNETVSVLIPFRREIHVSADRLRKHKAELRLIKPVKNGTIIAYHFND